MTAVKSPQVNNFVPDSQHLQGFNSFYRKLPEKPATTIRFFNRGEYYTVHGEDAIFTAKEWFKTTSFVKVYGKDNDKLESLVVNKANFEAYIRNLLLSRHYRVEVYTGGAKTNNWSLEFKGSPGNLSQFEDILFDNVDLVEGSAVVALKINFSSKLTQPVTRTVGVALIDCMEQKMSVCEITDDEYFSSTEALIVQLAAKECLLVSDNSAECDVLRKVVERSGVLITPRKRNDFAADNLSQDLNKLLEFKEGQQRNAAMLPQMNLSVAIGSLAAIIKYLDLMSNEENFGNFKIDTIENQRLVHVDSAALKALSVLPSSKVDMTNKHHSVYGLLDKCRTSHGRRLLMQWVRQPLKDMNAINERHDIVEALFRDTEVRQELYDTHLGRIPDFQSLAKKVRFNKATIQDCYRIYYGLTKLPPLINSLKSCNNSSPHPTLQSVFIANFEDQVNDTSKYVQMIETTLNLDLVDRGDFLIKADFDEELQEMQSQMEELEGKMRKLLSKAASALGLQENKTIKLESNSQYGYFFRVNLKDGKIIQNDKNYILLDTHKAGVRFRSERLTDLNEEYLRIHEQYTEQQKTIVAEVVKIAGTYCNALQYLSSLIASLDVLTSFALVAAAAPTPYVRPKLLTSDKGIILLEKARHPCVEMQDDISFIPNDVHFEQGSTTTYLITGPNMGGKSTYIRSIGVIALMAHIGSFVPCDRAEIQILDAIMARVGANDSQVKGMSTFMVEMVETSSIIRRATSNSLVIVDELGRGTSTYEGCGIASAIIEYLTSSLKSFTLFATHFHELTLLSQEISTIKNFHVNAVSCDDRLTHLYQVKAGACDQSFGIHVATLAKFPSHVIENAKRKLHQLENFLPIDSESSENEEITKASKEAVEIIDDFSHKCKKLKTEHSDLEQVRNEIKILKEQILAKGNPYIKALLCK